MQYRSSTSLNYILFLFFLPSYISHIFTQTANNKHTGILTPTLPSLNFGHYFPSSSTPGKMDRPQVPLYAGPAFHRSPSASALPIPNRFRDSPSGSGVRFNPSRKGISSLGAITHFQKAQCNAERPSDGDEAVPVTSDKSHEDKGAISDTKEQDGPVDAVMCHSSSCLTLSSCLIDSCPELQSHINGKSRGIYSTRES